MKMRRQRQNEEETKEIQASALSIIDSIENGSEEKADEPVPLHKQRSPVMVLKKDNDDYMVRERG